ncbi:MAG TPA: RNA polymerase factor sigma-54 [Alphaproteobacteria bacterium]|nr:RNA polymerase factor sigma-54 [Alphaproteobacteria bacterium]
MALTPRLDLRQTQSLVMTPQLQQAIKLLQLSAMELAEYVSAELEENPLLESEEGEEGDSGGAGESGESEPVNGADDGETPLDGVSGLWNGDDAPHQEDAPDQFADWGGGGRSDFDNGSAAIEETLRHEKSLRDHLLNQLAMDITDAADRLIGTHLVDLVDEAGYLTGDLAAVSQRLGCDVARVEATLEKLQAFDPPGIFARNLSECLALQLRDRNRLDPAMQALLDHLDLMARHDNRALLKICGVDAEDLTEMLAEIRALNPKPGLAFDHAVAQPIIPDVIMRPLPKGAWSVELNADTLPRVLVNNVYYAKVSRGAHTKDERDYISERYNAASWLVKALHQRATTILKVAKEIVRQQDAFFRHGVERLRPLILRDIAEAIGMHESTVSRVTTNKYIAGPRGIFELKYFFTSSIPASRGGEAHSAEAVRHRIKGLIDGETEKSVLSDEEIVDTLKAQGVDIARRTVAKYRESMRIPSSIERRRQKCLIV